MSRLITDHVVENDLAIQLKVQVVDEHGAGGANHLYQIGPYGNSYEGEYTSISFQNGPIKENGVNGLTHEALLAIVIDRLRSFQAGPYSCRDNAVALTHIEEALMWLQRRTRERIKRGVEGTNQK
jgi:hypothetical protein